MSYTATDFMLEHAIELADDLDAYLEMDDRRGDPSYIAQVAAILNAPHVDLEELQTLMKRMKVIKGQLDVDNLPEIIIW